MLQDDADPLHKTASNVDNDVQDGEGITAASVALKPSSLFLPPRWGETEDPGPPAWLVDQFMLLNAVNNLGGEPGIGKTRITAHLASSVASGNSFLGYAVQQGPVLYLNFDDSELLPRLWVQRAVCGLGHDMQELPLYYWDPEKSGLTDYPYGKGLMDERVLKNLFDWIEGIRDTEGKAPVLIVVDTFVAAFPNIDGNSNNAVPHAYAEMTKLHQACGGAAIVVNDHTPKGLLGEDTKRGVSGAQQKKAKARTQHLLRHSSVQSPLGIDRIEWQMDKNNAARVLPPFGILRDLDEVNDTDCLYVDDLPRDTGAPKSDGVYQFLIDIIKLANGAQVTHKALFEQAQKELSVSERTINGTLAKLKDDARLEEVILPGRGNPKACRWFTSETATEPHLDATFNATSVAEEELRLELEIDALLADFDNEPEDLEDPVS